MHLGKEGMELCSEKALVSQPEAEPRKRGFLVAIVAHV